MGPKNACKFHCRQAQRYQCRLPCSTPLSGSGLLAAIHVAWQEALDDSGDV